MESSATPVACSFALLHPSWLMPFPSPCSQFFGWRGVKNGHWCANWWDVYLCWHLFHIMINLYSNINICNWYTFTICVFIQVSIAALQKREQILIHKAKVSGCTARPNGATCAIQCHLGQVFCGFLGCFGAGFFAIIFFLGGFHMVQAGGKPGRFWRDLQRSSSHGDLRCWGKDGFSSPPGLDVVRSLWGVAR